MSHPTNTQIVESLHDEWQQALELNDVTAMRAVEIQLHEAGFSREARVLEQQRTVHEQ